jgi:hypothetical protein
VGKGAMEGEGEGERACFSRGIWALVLYFKSPMDLYIYIYTCIYLNIYSLYIYIYIYTYTYALVLYFADGPAHTQRGR